MEKPISMRIQEFKNSLVDLVNNSGLIPVIIEPIIKEIYMEVKTLGQQQFEKEKLEYEKFLQKGENNG